MPRWIVFHIIILLFLTHCKNESNVHKADLLLATVGKRSLYLSELQGLFPENSTAADSNNIILTYTDNWVRQTILLNEAEKYISDQIDINRLVKDYRESLLIHNYEEQLVQKRLDTVITEAQKLTFYEKNKNNYLLNRPIIRVSFAKIPKDMTDIDQFKRYWIRQEADEMEAYCIKYQIDHSFNENNWITLATLTNELPEDLFSLRQLKSGRSLDKEYDNIQYFVKLLDFRDENEVAPLAYIEDKIEKVILYNRKIDLLQNIKQDLYERELESNRIKYAIPNNE